MNPEPNLPPATPSDGIGPTDVPGAAVSSAQPARRRSTLTAFLALVCVTVAALSWRHDIIQSSRDSAAAQAERAMRPFMMRWQAATPAAKAAAIQSISAQLDAFKRDDYKRAIFYQSSALQRHFTSPAAFRVMMKTSYPEFARYKMAKFGPAQTAAHGLHARIPILLTGQDGVQVAAIYFMILENKIYRVEGVAGGAVAAPGVGPGITL